MEVAKAAAKALTGATGLIRREVGKRLGLRKTPEMKFVADDSIEYGMSIVKKLEEISSTSDDE
jgi:ribosome-binding factor A